MSYILLNFSPTSLHFIYPIDPTTMSENKPGGFLSRPITNKNHVPEMIEKIAAAKRAGAFTFQAGKADKIVNLAMGLAVGLALFNSARGVHQLANGYGKKEGF